MNWLIEIFENNSDKARLIAILISTAAAFTLLFLNQYFQNKREKKNHLVKKVEELYHAVLGLEYAAMDYLNESHNSYGIRFPGSSHEKASMIESDFKERIYKIRMLTGLYFSHIDEFSKEGV